MVQQLIVPVDGSPHSWRAFDVALALAHRTGSDVRLVEVASDPAVGRNAAQRLNDEVHTRGPFDVEVLVEVRLTIGSVADELATYVSLHPGATVVMASHGRGRSAALIGSVTEDALHKTFGPIILVGPNVEPGDFSGPVVVSVDGSRESELALPLAASWAAKLRATPWIVNVSLPTTTTATATTTATGTGASAFEAAYPARLAQDLTALSGHRVEFDSLHDRHPARAVPEYASRLAASMIVASSHGRSGLSRIVMGSVIAGFVRNATCPVTVVRLPHPVHTDRREHMWAY